VVREPSFSQTMLSEAERRKHPRPTLIVYTPILNVSRDFGVSRG
jgi:hypothetical protein